MRKPKGKRFSEKQWARLTEIWDVHIGLQPPLNRRRVEKEYRATRIDFVGEAKARKAKRHEKT